MDTVRICGRCGMNIASDAPQALCPQCLARVALESTTSGPGAQTLSDKTVHALPSGAKIRYFGDYELLEEIARGGMGIVYRARQISLDRIVAVKTILSGAFADQESIGRFRREAGAAARLQHPNIVSIHEIGEHEGLHYFSMDYVDGGTLAELIHKGPLPVIQAVRYMINVAQAVHHAHQRGVLHRDIKPSNVLIGSSGEARVADFGLAKQIGTDSGLTQTGQIAGTPAYMSPEQAAGRLDLLGVASDIYSLGALLYAALVGKPPFNGSSPGEILMQVLHRGPPSPSRLNPQIPRDLEAICLKCLEKHPTERYGSAAELADDLTRFLDHQQVHARPLSPLRQITSWFSERPWLLAGLAPTLLLAFILFTYGLWVENAFLRADQPLDLANLTTAKLVAFGMLIFLYIEAVRHWCGRKIRQRLLTGRLLSRTTLLQYAGLATLGLIGLLAVGAYNVRAWQWNRYLVWKWGNQPVMAAIADVAFEKLQRQAAPGYLLSSLVPLGFGAWSLGNLALLMIREQKFRLFLSVEEQLEKTSTAKEEELEEEKTHRNDPKILAAALAVGALVFPWGWLIHREVGYDLPVLFAALAGWLSAVAAFLQLFRLGWSRWLNLLFTVTGILTAAIMIWQSSTVRTIGAWTLGLIVGAAHALALRWINARRRR